MSKNIKQNLLMCFLVLSAINFSSCRNIKESSEQENQTKDNILRTEGVESIKVTVLDGQSEIEIKKQDEASILEIINSANFEDKLNDGRMIKMKPNHLTIYIQYTDKSEVTVLLWEDRIKVDKVWYLLNEKLILDALSSYPIT